LRPGKGSVAVGGLEVQGACSGAREAGGGIARIVRDRGVDLGAVGSSPERGATEGSAARCAESLFRHAPCEVIIDRLAETSLGASAEEDPIPVGAAPGRQE